MSTVLFDTANCGVITGGYQEARGSGIKSNHYYIENVYVGDCVVLHIFGVGGRALLCAAPLTTCRRAFPTTHKYTQKSQHISPVFFSMFSTHL